MPQSITNTIHFPFSFLFKRPATFLSSFRIHPCRTQAEFWFWDPEPHLSTRLCFRTKSAIPSPTNSSHPGRSVRSISIERTSITVPRHSLLSDIQLTTCNPPPNVSPPSVPFPSDQAPGSPRGCWRPGTPSWRASRRRGRRCGRNWRPGPRTRPPCWPARLSCQGVYLYIFLTGGGCVSRYENLGFMFGFALSPSLSIFLRTGGLELTLDLP